MKSKHLATIVALISAVIIVSCSKDSIKPLEERLVLPEETYDYTTEEDSGPFLGGFDNTPEDNLITDDGATLGRVLFHDKRMSKSNLISCSSCHLPKFGFGDNKAKSNGFVHEKTKRNSMAIVDLKDKANFFWDGRENILEEQVLRPVSDHIEMGIEQNELAPRIESLPYYADLFEKAFGDTEVTTDRVSKALSQYLRSMVSSNSKFDEGVENQFDNFTSSELNGRSLFFEELHCGSCHNGKNLGGWGATNIGLEMEYEDGGYADVDGGLEEQKGVFSVPTLRNIELTAPYMHDGRFNTLEEVIDHYASGVQSHQSLDFRLRFFEFGQWGTQNSSNDHFTTNTGNTAEGDPLRFELSVSEKNDLINFMKTLTDTEFINDVRFSNPFVYQE